MHKLFLLLLLSSALRAQPVVSDFIRVDQFGYRPGAEKVAVVAVPQIGFDAPVTFVPSTGAGQYQVRRVSDGVAVFTGTLQAWNGGATDPSSGDKAWWFDFSSVRTPGSYYVYDLGQSAASFAFDVRADVYAPVLRAAVRTFYYQRCNFPKEARYAGANWADGPSFSGPRQDGAARSAFAKLDPSTELDLSGGWWDAGDYNKYVTFAHQSVHQLLTAYAETPAVWTDNFDLPESGNGLPDLLDEVKYELDWLKKMQLPDGSSLIKVGTVGGDWNSPLPPSADRRARYYYPGGCTSATIANASMFAHAALVLGQFPAWQSYAADLRARAERGWTNFRAQPALQLDCDARTPTTPLENIIRAGDADASASDQRQAEVQTAIYLFGLTGNTAYRDFVDANYRTIRSVATSYWGPFGNAYDEALLYYADLPTATPAVVAVLRGNGPGSKAGTASYTGFYRFDRGATLDPYRCYMDSYMYFWGSNMVRANILGINYDMVTHGLDPANAAEYARKAEEGLHYFHGVNPLNLVYLTNMGSLGAEKSVDEIYHSWFRSGSDWSNAQTSARGGPAPGYVPGGPNPFYRDTDGSCPLAPPCGQPNQKSYRSWNADSPGNSYSVTEPAIYYQASYLKVLAKFVGGPQSPLPVRLTQFEAHRVGPAAVQLAWQTATETNNAGFVVEKSAEGRSFNAVGRLAGHGSSGRGHAYNFRDDAAAAAAYYRLAQHDQNGAVVYSPVAFVAAGPGAVGLSASPNPAHEALWVMADASTGPLLLRDLQGRVARRYAREALGAALDLRGLAAGVYFLGPANGSLRPVRVVVER